VLKRSHFSALPTIPTLALIGGAGMLVTGIVAARPLWLDEQMLLLNVRDRSFAMLGGPLWLDQSAPIAWLALERIMLLAFGSGERTVRLLTALFGCGTLVIAWWIGRRWMTAFGATILLLLCASGEWLVFFTLELKHYSSDALWALLLPAFAVWAIESTDRDTLRRRVTIWWTAAAFGQLLANGALFVAPACAMALAFVCWRRAGVRGLSSHIIGAGIWLLAFSVNVVIVLQPALDNAYLKNYWAFAFPPVSEGVGATLGWLLAQLRPMAVKPAGSHLGSLFWTAWTVGIGSAIARRQWLGVLYVAVPISAIALAIAHVVPPFERLGIWFIPSLYVGVALCADLGARLAFDRRAAAAARVVGVAAGAVASVVCADVVFYGTRAWAHRPQSNYRLDDRSSVRWLSTFHRAGDPVLTTHYGTAAIWWYAGVDIATNDGGSRLRDGSPLFEIKHGEGADCAAANDALSRVLAGHSRVDVYLGFRLNVEPPDFDEMVLAELSRRGRMTSYREYAEDSRLATFDLTQPGGQDAGVFSGCVTVREARRW
jgi:hypothetical protein